MPPPEVHQPIVSQLMRKFALIKQDAVPNKNQLANANLELGSPPTLFYSVKGWGEPGSRLGKCSVMRIIVGCHWVPRLWSYGTFS